MRNLRHTLPSLTALTAFEAAARHLSFKKAAAEMNVTPAAVSRQVGNLEAEVEQTLFRRLHRQVELTQAGETLYAAVSGGFGGIAAAVHGLKTTSGQARVTVGSTNAVASFWLLPRLKRFWARYPEVSVDHAISDSPVDLSYDNIDLAIQFGQGAWPGIESRFLFADTIYPVCSPDHLAASGAIKSVEDLVDRALLDVQVEARWVDWNFWLGQHGLRFRAQAARHLNNYVVAVQAAIDGQGIALGWHSLVGDLVDAGELTRPIGDALKSPGAFFLTYPAAIDLSPEARLFADWLREEAAETEAAA